MARWRGLCGPKASDEAGSAASPPISCPPVASSLAPYSGCCGHPHGAGRLVAAVLQWILCSYVWAHERPARPPPGLGVLQGVDVLVSSTTVRCTNPKSLDACRHGRRCEVEEG
jgi:hypothetical protein